MPDTPNPSSLSNRVLAGDPDAERELVEYFAPRVRAMALARTRDPDLAKDLAQEALVAVLQAARKGQIRDALRLEAFVAGVARNIINNHKRKSLRHPELPLDDRFPVAAADDHGAIERRRLLRQAMATLSPSDRQILVLTLVEGLKPGEIAGRIGASAEVVRTRKSRAVKRILEVIGSLSQNPFTGHLL
jgi:RNA polymerase sigma-70 factor, ECF subfamily